MNGREPYVPDVQRWIDYYVKQAEEYTGRGLTRAPYEARRLVRGEEKEKALPLTLVAPTQQIVEQAKSEQAREGRKSIRGGRARIKRANREINPIRGRRPTTPRQPIRGSPPTTPHKAIRGIEKKIRQKKGVLRIRDDVFGKR
jgi:hypothetical protein